MFNHQYGFPSMLSTECAVLEVLDKTITEMDNGKTTINIYIDLSEVMYLFYLAESI